MDRDTAKFYYEKLSILSGMINEIDGRRKLLMKRLDMYPDKVSDINKELRFLEGEFNAIMQAVNIIEKTPKTT